MPLALVPIRVIREIRGFFVIGRASATEKPRISDATASAYGRGAILPFAWRRCRHARPPWTNNATTANTPSATFTGSGTAVTLRLQPASPFSIPPVPVSHSAKLQVLFGSKPVNPVPGLPELPENVMS